MARFSEKPILLGIAFVVAFCSMSYELLLAQCLATIHGNSVFSYSLTVGIYLFSLGIGSLFAGMGRRGSPLRRLFWIEIVLASVGATAPILVLTTESLSVGGLGGGVPAVTYVSTHFWTLLIGILSGFEIPLLAEALTAHTGDEGEGAAVLAVDYFGTFVGAVAFPLVVYKAFGLLGTSFACGLLNVLAAFFVLHVEGAARIGRPGRAAYAAVAGALAVAIVFEAPLRRLLSVSLFG